MTKANHMPADMMASATRLHTDQTGWHVHKKLHQLQSGETLLQHNASVLVHTNQMENCLSEINANNAYAHERILSVLEIAAADHISLRIELVDRRVDAAFLIENFAASQRKACELANIARSSFSYRANPEKDNKLRAKLTQLAHEKPRYGYRRLAVLLRREGQVVNHKRLFRVYRAAGLSVRRKKRKRLMRVGQPLFTALRPNQQWAI